MTTTAAQDEFNELLRDKDIDHRHPEDRHDDSDLSDPESEGHADDYREIIDTDDELEIPVEMRSNNFHMPSLRSEANTGPKGVIADAQAFERDRKQQNRNSTWKSKPKSYSDDKASSDEDAEESFLRAWRARRVQELQNAGQRMRSRTISPSRRIYGTMPEANGIEYLDAVEKTVPNTVVVVLFCSHNYVCATSLRLTLLTKLNRSSPTNPKMRSVSKKMREKKRRWIGKLLGKRPRQLKLLCTK